MEGFLPVVKDVFSIIGVLAAAYVFLLRREFYPRAQFNLSMRILGERENEVLVELEATVKNVGIVRHRIKSFTFSLRALEFGSPWAVNPEKNSLINFPRKVHGGDWVRRKYTTLVEPGVEQKFNFVVNVSPANVEYLNLYANIAYRASWAPEHSAAITRSMSELKKKHIEVAQLQQGVANRPGIV